MRPIKPRRANLDIIAEILTVCKTENSKTAIVYKCNLNFKIITKYLNSLTLGGLLEQVKHEDDFITYRSTSKGSEVAQSINQVHESLTFARLELMPKVLSNIR